MGPLNMNNTATATATAAPVPEAASTTTIPTPLPTLTQTDIRILEVSSTLSQSTHPLSPPSPPFPLSSPATNPFRRRSMLIIAAFRTLRTRP